MLFQPTTLTATDVHEIVRLYRAGYGQRRIARMIGGEHMENAVELVLKGRTWKHITGGRIANGIRPKRELAR